MKKYQIGAGKILKSIFQCNEQCRSFTIYFIFYLTDNLQGAMVSPFSQICYGIC